MDRRPRALSDDVLRYSLCGFHLAGLEQMLVPVNRTLKRNKAFDEDRVQGRIAAGCQIISSPVKPFPAWEWLQPGEGEDTAALRLLRRIPEQYDSRFFDIPPLDSLYAQKPALQLTQQIGWDVVITFKLGAARPLPKRHGVVSGPPCRPAV